MSVWTHGYLCYALGYNATLFCHSDCSSFGHWGSSQVASVLLCHTLTAVGLFLSNSFLSSTTCCSSLVLYISCPNSRLLTHFPYLFKMYFTVGYCLCVCVCVVKTTVWMASTHHRLLSTLFWLLCVCACDLWSDFEDGAVQQQWEGATTASLGCVPPLFSWSGDLLGLPRHVLKVLAPIRQSSSHGLLCRDCPHSLPPPRTPPPCLWPTQLQG